MGEEVNVAELKETVAKLKTISALQTIAMLNLWGVVQARNNSNESEYIKGWLKEAEDKIKEISEIMVGMASG